MRLRAFLRGALGVPKQSPEAIVRIKLWARAALDGSEDTAFAINEITCNDPRCAGVETVILIMEPGRKTRACKVAKALEAVTELDVRQALEA